MLTLGEPTACRSIIGAADSPGSRFVDNEHPQTVTPRDPDGQASFSADPNSPHPAAGSQSTSAPGRLQVPGGRTFLANQAATRSSPSRAWSMSSDFMKYGAPSHHRLIQALEPHCDSTGLDAGGSAHRASHAGPLRVAHRAVEPLAAGNPRLEQPTRIPRALIDRRQFDAGHGQQI
jgi:hypothetical protein